MYGKKTIVLADDHHALRFGLKVLINKEPDMIVAGEAEDGVSTLELVKKIKPDVLVLDCKLPQIDGIEVAHRIRNMKIATKVLGFSAYENEYYIKGMLKAKVSGYILKDEIPADIIKAIRRVAQGKTWYSQSVTAKITDLLRDMEAGVNELTKREIRILTSLAGGLSNQGIADDLSISERTVRFHLKNIYDKLYINSRTEAVLWTLKNIL